jgi:hypothetical protein
VGHIVGLRDDLIPESADDGLRLGHTILDNQLAESDHSKALMKSLLDFQDSISKPFFSSQGNIEMMRLMMGDKISDILAVPAADSRKVKKLGRKIKIIASIAEFLDHSLIFALVIQFISKIGLQLMITRMTPSRIINFYLPKSLTQDWGVTKN